MPRVEATILVPGRIAEAEALFYDPRRRPSWVDGYGTTARVEEGWPREGKLVWESRPGGRGRVVERVTAFEERVSQTCTVEEERLRGTQTVTFAAEESDTRVTVSFEFSVEQRSLLGPLQSFFVRRAMRDSLARTLYRFAVERQAELGGGLG
jgi:hypothetical protein